MRDKILLAIGALLILIGFFNPNLSNILPVPRPSVVSVDYDIPEVSNDVKSSLSGIVDALINGSEERKMDGKKLAQLYIDMSTLISLDGEDKSIKTTDDIRQANSLVGAMLKISLKDKYPDLKKACTDYVISQIGNDNVPLDEELRAKASQTFQHLAWACNEGSK
jgi:hypothetical protein